MDPRELLLWCKHLLVWAPKDSFLRGEIQQMIDKLKQHTGQQ
jgi:hypothetical protein